MLQCNIEKEWKAGTLSGTWRTLRQEKSKFHEIIPKENSLCQSKNRGSSSKGCETGKRGLLITMTMSVLLVLTFIYQIFSFLKLASVQTIDVSGLSISTDRYINIPKRSTAAKIDVNKINDTMIHDILNNT